MRSERRITATQVYGYMTCPRAVALDLHGDPEHKRARTEMEELVLQRGRELEARIVGPLGYETPGAPAGDFEAGARATRELMRRGVPGIAQGVLWVGERLGVPDLLRKEAGASALGNHHYVVGDVKSSARPRGDQILQVVFYDRLLRSVQGRRAAYAFLVLADGGEYRFDPADYDEALDDVLAGLDALAQPENGPRPFLRAACRRCRWSEECRTELEERDDLSLVQGMTPGLRELLEDAGISSAGALRESEVEPLAERTRIERALLRRLVRAAHARALGRPLRERAQPAADLEPAAVVHLLRDHFQDRVLWFGTLWPARPGGEVFDVMPRDRGHEWRALHEVLDRIPREARLLHYGEAFQRWYEELAWRRPSPHEIDGRLVDLARRLRGAAVFPAPIFGLDDHVRYGLGQDPNRAGDAAEVALWAGRPGRLEKVRRKGRCDLEDLARLKVLILEGERVRGPVS